MAEDVHAAKALAFIKGLIDDRRVFRIEVLSEVPEKVKAQIESREFAQHFCPEDCPQIYVPGYGTICQNG